MQLTRKGFASSMWAIFQKHTTISTNPFQHFEINRRAILCNACLTWDNYHAKIPTMKLVLKYGCVSTNGKVFS